MTQIDLTLCEEIVVKAILVISATLLLIRIVVIGIRDIRDEINKRDK
jgi:hypothetical protein